MLSFKPGQIVKLRSHDVSQSAHGTGIVVNVDGFWVNVSWSWADGRVGRNHHVDLVLVNK